MIKHAVRLLAVGTCLGLFIAWAMLLRPPVLGGPATYLIVRGDSMLPTYQTGDLLILHARVSYSVGDAVAYRVPSGELGAGRLVVHRIVGGDGATGYVLQGDNNPAPDPWSPMATDVVGSPWLAVPGVGRAVAVIRQPAVAGGLAAALLVALLVSRSYGRAGVRPAELPGPAHKHRTIAAVTGSTAPTLVGKRSELPGRVSPVDGEPLPPAAGRPRSLDDLLELGAKGGE